MIHGIYSIFCSKQYIDLLYLELKKLTVHFAIVFTDIRNRSFYDNLVQNTNIIKVKDHESLEQTIEYIQTNTCNKENIGDFIYAYVVLVKKLSFLSQKLLYSTEIKLHKLICNYYPYLFSYHCTENEFRKFPIYGSSIQDNHSKNVLIVEKANGYGDGIVSIAVLAHYTQILTARGYHVEVWHCYEKTYLLASTFLAHCTNSYSPLAESRSAISEINFNKPYSIIKNFDDMIVSNAFEKLKEVADFLGCSCNFPLSSIPINPVQICESAEFQLTQIKKSYQHIIGVQFYTDDNAICSYKREWNSQNVKEFIRLCHNNQIGIVNLAPYNDRNLIYDMDVSLLKIPEIISIINRIDMVVGIDSCCGHFAGILEKPNLILWGKVLQKKSQRPVSSNYSIISRTCIIDHIPPDLVIERTRQILTGEVVLPHTLNTNAHFEEDSHTEYVDGP